MGRERCCATHQGLLFFAPTAVFAAIGWHDWREEMDYRELAEKVVENCRLQRKDHMRIFEEANAIVGPGTAEVAEQIMVERVEEILRSALTPTWTDTPAPLPEGAVCGVYLIKWVDEPVFGYVEKQFNLGDIKRIRSLPATEVRYMGPLAAWMGPENDRRMLPAFDAAGEVV